MHALVLLANASILLLVFAGLYALYATFGWEITVALIAFAAGCNALAIFALWQPTSHTTKEYT